MACAPASWGPEKMTTSVEDQISQRIRFLEGRRAAAIAERTERIIAGGPPSRSRISFIAWARWHRDGFVFCPGRKRQVACDRKECRMGASCSVMALKGQYGDGSAKPRRQRPICGAKTRSGGACAMRVEPGKHRCRLHGGLSTGPKTEEGRQRVAQAQRERRKNKGGAILGRPTTSSASAPTFPSCF